MSDPTRYWFPAKRYGWGWGPPTQWQGWVVLVAFFAAEFALALKLLPDQPPMFALGTVVLVGVLVGICLAKGEPPGWRSGGDKS
jgi:hypothetical protein